MEESKTFTVNILTPEKQFLSDSYDSLVCKGIDGEICILKNHCQMLLAVDYGFISLGRDGEKRTAVCGAGFLEVVCNNVFVFVDSCHWAENIEQAKEEAEKLRRAEQQSIKEHRMNAVELTRIVADIGRAGVSRGHERHRRKY